jgi:signal transduction histidine kinase
MATIAPVRVLLIDDDKDDYILTRDLLADLSGSPFEVDWQPDFDAALETICRNAYDVYLLDYRLGRRDGLELLQEARRRGCSGPIILLTGKGQRELDVVAMQTGAADYLEKNRLDATLLERSIRYALRKQLYEEDLERQVRERTEELSLANEALREADRRKDAFLATLAHELRNPLAPMRNALEIMRLSRNRPEAVETGRTMLERQIAHLVRLIDDLLDISRISRGKIQLRKELVDVSPIVAGVLEGSRPLIDAGRHQLTVALSQSPIRVLADPTRLTQILINLLNNAAKYTEPGGRIDLTATVENRHIVFRVRDTGIGIDHDMLPRIFEMFAQVDQSRDRSQGGLGIGLSLVRGLIALHGGTVEAFSDGPGRGSEFVVRIPQSDK